MSELKTPLAPVRYGGSLLYGGAQNRLPKRREQKYGCGPIAAANMVCHLETGSEEIDEARQLRTARRIKRLTPLGLGLRGTNGWFLAAGMNLYFLTKGQRRFAWWGASGKKLWSRVDELLERDIPVILAIGPNFPKFWGRDALNLYQKAPSGALVRLTSTKAHFVTVTASDGDELTISSWGRKYVILKSEYDDYAKKHSNYLFCNVMLVSK